MCCTGVSVNMEQGCVINDKWVATTLREKAIAIETDTEEKRLCRWCLCCVSLYVMAVLVVFMLCSFVHHGCVGGVYAVLVCTSWLCWWCLCCVSLYVIAVLVVLMLC